MAGVRTTGMANHGVTFFAVSRAPSAKLQAYKKRMGWSFPWASKTAGVTLPTASPSSRRRRNRAV